MALIEISGLTKTYIERSGLKTEALKGVDLSIDPGAFISIAGPSGSGKTTLLNIIGALDKPTSGKLIFDKIDITAVPVTKLADFRLNRIGFVFQAYNLFNTLTALENVEYIMLLKNTPSRSRRSTAEETLRKVGLESYMHKRPNQLSGGQQQRVAVARALASQPKCILADEPTANLDSKTAEDLIDFMRDLNTRFGLSFIFSTHDKMVMGKADKVFTLKDGKIIT